MLKFIIFGSIVHLGPSFNQSTMVEFFFCFLIVSWVQLVNWNFNCANRTLHVGWFLSTAFLVKVSELVYSVCSVLAYYSCFIYTSNNKLLKFFFRGSSSDFQLRFLSGSRVGRLIRGTKFPAQSLRPLYATSKWYYFPIWLLVTFFNNFSIWAQRFFAKPEVASQEST